MSFDERTRDGEAKAGAAAGAFAGEKRLEDARCVGVGNTRAIVCKAKRELVGRDFGGDAHGGCPRLARIFDEDRGDALHAGGINGGAGALAGGYGDGEIRGSQAISHQLEHIAHLAACLPIRILQIGLCQLHQAAQQMREPRRIARHIDKEARVGGAIHLCPMILQ